MLLTGVPAKTDAMGKKPGKDWKVGLSQGNGYRQLQAPLIFFAKKTINVDATPLATAIGLFDGDPASPGATGPHADGSAQSLLITFPPTTRAIPTSPASALTGSSCSPASTPTGSRT